MKSVLICFAVITAAVFCSSAGAADENGNGLPAFPGAEGFGAVSKGGRGGKVIKVTNLNAKGPGSLQWACEQEGPRIVVFDVSGVITFKRGRKPGIRIMKPNIYIAGQTAPGAGITVRGKISSYGSRRDDSGRMNDITIRFMRARPGYAQKGGYVTGGRAIEIEYTDRAIVDHCSGSWAVDEEYLLWTDSEVTVQWCAVEESDVSWEGGDEPHNFGMLVRGHRDKASFSLHHLLFAHHHSRSPSDYGNVYNLDSRNNVLYNFGTSMTCRSGNLVNNYLKVGPGAVWGMPRIYHPPTTYTSPGISWGVTSTKAHARPSFVNGNFLEGAGGYYEPKARGMRIRRPLSEKENPLAPVKTYVAEEAYKQVMAQTGCLPRDAVSKRTIYEVETRTGLWGRELPPEGLMQGLTPAKAPADSDNDGMPDAWEKTHGLDPKNPEDAVKTVPAGASRGDRHKGYTYIEFYVNELADIKIARAMTEARLNPGPGKEPPKPKYIEPPKPVSELVSDITAQNAKTKKTDTNKTFRAIWALYRMDPRVTAEAVAPLIADLAKAIETSDKRKACFVAWVLGALGPHADAGRIVPALMKALEHDFNVSNSKWEFCPHGFVSWAIGCYGQKAEEAIPLLAKTVHGKDRWARQPAAWALRRMGASAEPAADSLIKALDYAEGIAWGASAIKGGCRYHAAAVLADIGKPVVPKLIKVLGSNSPSASLGAAMALGRMGDKAGPAVPELIKMLDHKNPINRAGAAEALSRIDPKADKVVSALAGALGDADYGVRNRVAKALARCGPAAGKALPALEKALADTYKEVRYAAFCALGEIGPEAEEVLTKALGNRDDAWNRKYAARSLGTIGPKTKSGVPALVKALKDADAEVRREAVWSLGLMGPQTKKAANALKETAEEDPDYVTAFAAGHVLGLINTRILHGDALKVR